MVATGKSSRLGAISINQGLTDVYVPVGGNEDLNSSITVDIVAVPGLGAVPGKTWTFHENGIRVNWLQDKETMLPKRFPTARIMEFEYPSKYYGEGAVNQTLGKVAEALLTALTIKRKGCNRRPIIFIAHCLGGLIVEKAICLAKARIDEYKAVYNAIAGAAFLATPFLGTKTELKAALLNDILNVLGNGSDSDLLPLLEFKNQRLKEMLDEFSRIINETRISTFCFYESQKSDLGQLVLPKWMRKWPSKTEKIVSQESATLPGRSDTSAYLERDHFKINKFYGAQDGAYIVVQNELGKMIRNAGVFVKGRLQDAQRSLIPDDKYEEVKKQLSAFDEDAVISQVKKSRPDMFATKGAKAPCSFLLEEPEWKRWLQPSKEGPEALWIRGKKGQGKTLFAVDVVGKFKEQCSKEGEDGQNFFVYCFCDGKKPDTSSAANLLKVIIRQLIVQKRDLTRYFLASGKSKEAASYSVPYLMQKLLKISNDPSVGTIYIIIDGLDSLAHDDARNELLSEISQLLRTKSDRSKRNDYEDYDNRSESADQPYPMIKLLLLSNTLNDDIASALQGQTFIDLSDEKYKALVDQGISEDFSQRIVDFSRRRKYGPPSEYIMKSYIKSKAQSEPAWVTLACGEIEALEVQKSKIRGYLEALPTGTSALFKQIMDRILDHHDTEVEVTKELFRCVLLAKSEPNLDELAIMAGFSDSERTDRVLLHKYVKKCAPFVILNQDTSLIEFAMPEIKDLFESYAGETLFPSESSRKFQHGLMALRCFDYLLNNISSTELTPSEENDTYENDETEEGDDYSEDSGLAMESSEQNQEENAVYIGPMEVSYPHEQWLNHSKDAEIDMLNSLDLESSFWERNSVMRENWWKEYTEIHDEYEYLSSMSSLHIAAFFGFDALIDRLLEKGRKSEVETEDSWGNTPLYWAAKKGHRDSVTILLKAGAIADGHRGGDDPGLTALYGAATEGQTQIVEELIKRGANSNFYHQRLGSPLFTACSNGHISIVHMLLNAGADANLGVNAHTTPLQGAVWSGQGELVRLILEKGVRAEYGSDKKFDFTPLWSASDYGYTDIVDILLHHGANVNWTREGYGNSLSAACQRASIETVKSLLRANPNASCQQDALPEAVWGGSPEIVALLVEHNPRLQRDEAFVRASSNGDNKSLQILASRQARISQKALDESLYFASDNELRDTVKLLLSMRANPSARGRTYGSALGAACFDGTFDIVKALVDMGADVNQEGGDYGSPLQAASFRGSLDIVKLLLSKGARPDSRPSGQYATALQAAAVAGSNDIVKILLDHGADIDALGGAHGTALLAAANCRHPDTFKMLVERGANVNIVSQTVNQAEPALQVAAYALAAENVQLLLDHGAIVDQPDSIGYTPLMASADVTAAGMLLKRGANPNWADKDGDTPIIEAIRNGSSDVCKLLLEHGADPNCVNTEGRTPLMGAVEVENLEICQILVEHGAEVNKVTNHEQGTALHQACFRGNSALLQFFLQKEADLHLQAGTWGTCLQAAVLRTNTDFVSEVLEAGAEINATGGKYETAIAAAAYAAEEDVVSLLLQRGADANITGGYYGSALGSAAAKGWLNLIDRLLPKTSQSIINDALSKAVLYRRAAAVEKLLEHGAKVNVASRNFANPTRALDVSFNPNENTDDDLVFEGYSIQTDDAADFTELQTKPDDEDEQTKEEFFKAYYSKEFLAAPAPATAAPAVKKSVENVKLKERESAIRTSLAKAAQTEKNVDPMGETFGTGTRGFINQLQSSFHAEDGTSREIPHRSKQTGVSDFLDAAKGLFGRKTDSQHERDIPNGNNYQSQRGFESSDRSQGTYENSSNGGHEAYNDRGRSSNWTAPAYGAAGFGAGAVAGVAANEVGGDWRNGSESALDRGFDATDEVQYDHAHMNNQDQNGGYYEERGFHGEEEGGEEGEEAGEGQEEEEQEQEGGGEEEEEVGGQEEEQEEQEEQEEEQEEQEYYGQDEYEYQED